MADRPVNNKRQRAVALRYGADPGSPEIVAAGAGEIARRIIELAREHNVPVYADDMLAQTLAQFDVGMEIPPETYRAVAEILAFLYRTDNIWRRKKDLQRKEQGLPTFAEEAKAALMESLEG